MSKERPLLVSSALIGPILRGEKTVTRRLPRNPGGWHLHPAGPTTLSCYHTAPPHFYAERDIEAPCAVGDVLWVRETWMDPLGTGLTYRYRADRDRPEWAGLWRPSIHMPRKAARIFLRVEDVRVERVQEITEEDARAEGVIEAYDGVFDDVDYCARAKAMGAVVGDARPTFALVWDSLAPAGSKWADNPWVWVIRFKLEAPNVR